MVNEILFSTFVFRCPPIFSPNFFSRQKKERRPKRTNVRDVLPVVFSSLLRIISAWPPPIDGFSHTPGHAFHQNDGYWRLSALQIFSFAAAVSNSSSIVVPASVTALLTSVRKDMKNRHTHILHHSLFKITIGFFLDSWISNGAAPYASRNGPAFGRCVAAGQPRNGHADVSRLRTGPIGGGQISGVWDKTTISSVLDA